MKKADYFRDRTAVRGTKHRKEVAVAPLPEKILGMNVIVPADFDTDRFGTFPRDIARVSDQRTTARRKAEAAMRHMGLTMGIASEGSFGPHPLAPMLPTNLEVVVLLDRQYDFEVIGQSFSADAVMAHETVGSTDEALALRSRRDGQLDAHA
jgi:hypothetical protein